MFEPEVTGEQQAAEDRRIAILNALGQAVAAKRREAAAARQASGIEDEWQGDEEFYQGYDDANRHEFTNTATKPSASGASSEPTPRRRGSTVFPNITQPYVDAASARVGDMLLPTDDRNFAIEATPVPDIFEDFEEQVTPEVPAAMPQSPMAQAVAGALPQQATPQPMVQLPGGEAMPLDQAKAAFDRMKAAAAKSAEKAQTRIDDWLSECQYHAEVRKVIDDASKLGSGVIKGPVPVMRKARQWRKGDDGVSMLVMVEEIKPGSRRIDPWNLFPDGACGENIHDGAHIFERDFITSKRLEELKDDPKYIASQIDLCLGEGPRTASAGDARDSGTVRSTKGQFEIWYMHGSITTDELIAAGCDCGPEEGRRDSYPAMLTMVNDRVIHAALNPLDSGDFPYDIIPWKRRPGMPWGMGVARQMRTPQRIVVAATRNMMDNAGLGAGPQIIVRRGVVPQDGKMEIYPLKVWIEGTDSDGQAGAPFLTAVIPMLQVELMAIIQFGMKLAEDVTGLPMLLQGQQGKAPDTVGGMTILNNNANSVLRRIARLFDSSITEPHIRRYYTWLMEYGDDGSEKGDFQIIARGSTALVERDIQSQEMVNVVQMTLNPIFKKNPAKAMDEYLKSRRFDPAAFDYTEEELKALAAQTPPEDPRVTAAKIMAEARGNETVARTQVRMEELNIDQHNADMDRALEHWQTEIDATIEAAKLDGGKAMNQDQIKAKLAETNAKLMTQMRLAMRPQGGPQMLTPPVEPTGRAAPGMAYQQ